MSTVTPLSHKPDLRLGRASVTDLSEITVLWYACFSSPFMDKMFPPSPSLYAWWTAANSDDMLTKPSQVYLKVSDVSPEGKGKIVGYAKWGVWQGGEERMLEDRFPPWAEESDKDLCDRFMGTLAKERRRLLGDPPRGHYYLDMLCTLPEYRRMGAARLLIEWGCKKADEDGKEAYVDASDEGKPVYIRFGFEQQTPFSMEVDGKSFNCTSFLRPAKK